MLKRSSIPSSPKKCSDCEKPFEDGQVVFSALYELSDSKWGRYSWCEKCRAEQLEDAEYISTWKTIFSKKPEKQRIPSEALIDLLDKAIENELWRPISSLLAWYLVRKKYLKFAGEKTNEGETYLCFSLANSDEERLVPGGEPTSEQVARFHDLLAQIDEFES